MTSSQAQDADGAAPGTVPAQRIEVRGDATPEQVAALVAVLSAAAGGPVEAGGHRAVSEWSAPARAMRRPLTPGPAAWQNSLRP